ncbi:MAG: chemotaxis protein CheW [Myxococcota bacterium]
MSMPETVSEERARSSTGKYMSFRLAAEEYGLEILKVREIIGLLPMTRVPNKPDCMRGVINLRGRIIPVVDLRRKFGLAANELGEQAVIIVVQYQQSGVDLTVGMLVDEVLEVLKLQADQVDLQPDYGNGTAKAQFVRGIGKLDQRMVFLVHLEKVLTDAEAQNLAFTGEAQ